MSETLRSNAFANGRAIPRRYSEDGEDLSPPLTWTGLPQGTKELALIVDDPDAPRPEPWVFYKIPADVRTLTEGLSRTPDLVRPTRCEAGQELVGTDGYHFRLHVLDAPLAAAQGLDKAGLLEAMRGHVLAEAELVGTYER